MNTKKTKKTKKSFSLWVGNTLIIISVLFLGVLYLPLLTSFLNPEYPQAQEAIQKNFSIRIPSIKAYATVSENVDPWNETLYQEYLQKGVAHAKGTGLPGDGKTIFLFAHSSDVPWRITRYNTPFLRLGSLDTGDSIEIYRNGKLYKYLVSDKKTVSPTAIEYLKPGNTEELILQTCTPIGTSINRLLIFAKPEEN